MDLAVGAHAGDGGHGIGEGDRYVRAVDALVHAVEPVPAAAVADLVVGRAATLATGGPQGEVGGRAGTVVVGQQVGLLGKG